MSLDRDEVRRPDRRMQAVLDACSVVGFWEWDHVRHVAVYDRGAAFYLAGDADLAERELAAETAVASIYPADLAWLREQTIRAAYGNGLLLSEYRVLLRGDVHWVLSRGRTQRDAQGRPRCTRGMLIDITETREAGDGYVTEALSAQAAPLEQAADHAMAMRRILGADASPALTLIADMLLLQLAREIAQSPEPDASKLH